MGAHILTTAPRAPKASADDEMVDGTVEAMLNAVQLRDVLASLARVCERRRFEARDNRKPTADQVYDLVQGRLELAIDDLKRLGK